MKTISKYKIFVENSQYIYLGTIVSEIFSFIVSILVIRKLSVETFGTFNFLIASFFVFRVIGISSISSLFNRYIPELVEKKDFKRLRRFIKIILFLSMVILGILIFLLLLTQNIYANFFKIENFTNFIYAFLIFLTTRYLMSITENILNSLLLNKSLAIYKMIRSAASPVLYLIFLPVLSVNIMLLIESVFCLMIAFPSFFKIYSYLKINEPLNDIGSINNDYKKRMIRYGLLSSFDQIGMAVIGRTSDYFIISAMANQFSVGIFSFAHKLFSMLDRAIPINEILNTIRPMFIQKFTSGFDENKFNTINNLMIKMILPVYIIPFLLFLLFGESIINYIYDPKYLASYWLTCILFFAPILIMFYYPTILLVQLKEKVEFQLITNILAVLSIIGGIFFMKWFGVLGIVIATSIGNFLRKYIIYLFMRRSVNIKFRLSELMNYIYISIFVSIVFLLLQGFVTSIISLVIFISLFLFTSVLLLILFHPFNNEELEFINNFTLVSKPLAIISSIVVRIYGLKTYILKLSS